MEELLDQLVFSIWNCLECSRIPKNHWMMNHVSYFTYGKWWMVGGIFLIFFEYIFQTKKKQKLQSTSRKTNMEAEKISWKRRHIYKPHTNHQFFGVPAVCFCGEIYVYGFGMCHTPQPVTLGDLSKWFWAQESADHEFYLLNPEKFEKNYDLPGIASFPPVLLRLLLVVCFLFQKNTLQNSLFFFEELTHMVFLFIW